MHDMLVRSLSLRLLLLGVVTILGAMLMLTRVFGGVFSSTRPENLGLHDGKLALCPNKPNCVHSAATDPRHAIAPLAFTGDPEEAMQTLYTIISDMARTQVITREVDYLYVEVTSKLLGFVDDVEFMLDRQARLIQVRSAARLGYSDFGVNRRRIETIRAMFNTYKP
jgi:uncharacterized protein (DUF1499 family)